MSDLGPQTDFTLPPGILRADGRNTLALAVWSPVAGQGGLGQVSLVARGNYASGLRIGGVPAPGFSQAVYGKPVRAGGATLGLTPSVPVVGPGQTVTVTGRVTAVGQGVEGATAALSPPAGWTATPSGPVHVGRLGPS